MWITLWKSNDFPSDFLWIIPKMYKIPPKTSRFEEWKNKSNTYLEKSIFRQRDTFLFSLMWKNSPTFPGGKTVEKIPVPHF